MIRRIGLALIATALLLPLQVMAQKGGRSSSHSSRSSSSTRSASRKTNILPGRFCVVSGQTNSCGRSRGERVSGSLLFTV
jgi:hypothetical protein